MEKCLGRLGVEALDLIPAGFPDPALHPVLDYFVGAAMSALIRLEMVRLA
ncbi:MAG: hypothetical protein WDM84_04275 [Bauldia sp.]